MCEISSRQVTKRKVTLSEKYVMQSLPLTRRRASRSVTDATNLAIIPHTPQIFNHFSHSRGFKTYNSYKTYKSYKAYIAGRAREGGWPPVNLSRLI